MLYSQRLQTVQKYNRCPTQTMNTGNIFYFRSTGGQHFRFPVDFADHRYNSADAAAQPVMLKR